MLTIDRMDTDLRLAGRPEARAQLARRLDRIAIDRVGLALEAVAAEFAAEAGEVIRIRRLDLTLWLEAARLDDGAIARTWAETLARALWHQLAHGGPSEVRRWPDRAAYLATWAADHAAGRAEGRWDYAEFATLGDVPTGRAVVHVLARDPRWIGPVFEALARSRSVKAVIAAFGPAEVEALWRAWTGGPPEAPPTITTARLGELAGLRPPEPESGGSAARARTALHWLVALSTGRGALPAEVAGGLALQLAHLAFLVAALPELGPRLVSGELPDAAVVHRLRSLGPAAAVTWFESALTASGAAVTLAQLARIALPPAPRPATSVAAPRPDRIVTGYAGLALLLPALRALDPDGRLGADGRHALLTAAIPPPLRLLARGDAGLRWLSGLGPEQPCRPEAVDWPPPDGRDLSRDIATHGDGTELPLLRLLLDRFARGLRGMERASAGYLAHQFLALPGRIERSHDRILVRIERIPLRVVLAMAGRLGEQGPLPWLDDRLLILETADG